MRRSVVVFALVVFVGTACSGGNGAKDAGRDSPTTTATTAPPRSIRAEAAPWRLPAARGRETVLAQDQALLVIGGQDAEKSSVSSVYSVPIPQGGARMVAELPTPVHDAAGAVLGDDVFVFGGGAANTVATVQRYRNGVVTKIGTLPRPRSDAVAATIDGTAYILGGFDGTNDDAAVLATTDGTTYRTVASLMQTVRYPAVAVADGRIWLFGGDHNGTFVTTVQVFDPKAGTVEKVTDLPQPLAHASAVVINGTVFLLGGRSRGAILDSIQQYDVRTGTVAAAGTLPYAVADAGAAVVGDTAYLVGGETPSATDRVAVVAYR